MWKHLWNGCTPNSRPYLLFVQWESGRRDKANWKKYTGNFDLNLTSESGLGVYNSYIISVIGIYMIYFKLNKSQGHSHSKHFIKSNSGGRDVTVSQPMSGNLSDTWKNTRDFSVNVDPCCENNRVHFCHTYLYTAISGPEWSSDMEQVLTYESLFCGLITFEWLYQTIILSTYACNDPLVLSVS